MLAKRILLIVAAFAFQQANATVALPKPDKPVGYVRIDLATEQPDSLTPAQGDTRTLALELWYPARDGGRTRSWASEQMGSALSDQFPFPRGFQSEARAHAVSDARMPDGEFPIVIFSPGLSFPVTLYQSFTESIASRGYIVIAVNHPHASPRIEYAEGPAINMSLWPTFDDETAKERFLAEHAAVWEQDLVNVLDAIEAWTVASPRNPVAGHLDVERIGVVGHSYGGTAAGRLTRDQRVDAAVAMEGHVRDPADERSRGSLEVGAPFLHIIGGYNRLEMEIADYQPAPGAPVYRVVVNGAGHAHFSDLMLLYSNYADAEWRARHRYELAPSRILQIAVDYIGAFLDRYLNGRDDTPLLRARGLQERLDGPRSGGYPEVDLTVDVRPSAQ